MKDFAKATGIYKVSCFDKNGQLKWNSQFPNLIVNLGLNILLDTLFKGNSYSVTGPYMGLISSVGWSQVLPGDTMASHAGWTEAGSTTQPTYSGLRQTLSFSSASGGSASSSAAVFNMTGNGTLEGAFIVLGTGASSTLGSTGGTLFSAGAFDTGPQIIGGGDILNVTYTATLTA